MLRMAALPPPMVIIRIILRFRQTVLLGCLPLALVPLPSPMRLRLVPFSTCGLERSSESWSG